MISYYTMGFKKSINVILNLNSQKIFFYIFFLFSVSLYAFPVSNTQSTASLTLSHITAQPGDRIHAYITLSLQPDWYTYWKNPGDVGEPLSLKWQLPPTITIHPMQWTAPGLFKTGSITSYGFKNQVHVAVPLSLSKTLTTGIIPFTVTANWLICKDICIPQQATLYSSLGIATTRIENPDAISIVTSVNDQRPIPMSEFAEYMQRNNTLWIKLPYPLTHQIHTIQLYPNQRSDFSHHLTIRPHTNQNATYLSATIDPQTIVPDAFTGILQLHTDDGVENVALQFKESLTLDPPTQPLLRLIKLLLFSFMGGLLLNIMPCVFPILSLKVLELVHVTTEKKRTVRLQAWAYTVGVVFSLTLLGSLLMLLKSIGYQLGWGFQLQEPLVIMVLIWVLLFVTLNLFGWFELPGAFYTTLSKWGTKGHHLQEKTSGLKKSMLTGVLATVAATPCTAPFMATAIGAALLMTSPLEGISIFIVLGLGLASPFLVLTYIPFLRDCLPKPGQWMIYFKKWLALPMALSVIWLVWVLYQQVPLAVVQWVILSIFNIIILCRLLIKYALKPLTKGLLLLLTFMGVGLIISYVVLNPKQPSGMPQQSFSLPLLQTHISTQRRVFVDVTAAWCITCKINEKTTLNTDKMASFFNKNDIITMTADWTTHNTEITTYLSTFERSGVPLYVFYNREGSPIILPQVLTKKNVMTLISTHIDSEE